MIPKVDWLTEMAHKRGFVYSNDILLLNLAGKVSWKTCIVV